LLVDAHGVDPEEAIFVPLPELAQCIGEVLSDGDLCVGAVDAAWEHRIAPSIGESLVRDRWSRIEIGIQEVSISDFAVQFSAWVSWEKIDKPNRAPRNLLINITTTNHHFHLFDE